MKTSDLPSSDPVHRRTAERTAFPVSEIRKVDPHTKVVVRSEHRERWRGVSSDAMQIGVHPKFPG